MPTATLNYGLSDSTINGRVGISYQASEILGRLVLTGSQTYNVDLAMMLAAGLKGLIVSVDTLDDAGAAVTTPVTVTWTSNSASKSQELSPGGAFLLANPSPVHSVTALSIVSTANAVVHVAALG